MALECDWLRRTSLASSTLDHSLHFDANNMSKQQGLFPPKRQRRPDRMPHNPFADNKILWRLLQ